jgi:hypothetical protein
MGKIKLLGIAGKKKSGKDLAAKYIQDILRKKDPSRLTGAVGFADGVKSVAAEALSINRMTFFEDKNKEKLFRIGKDTELTGREILQRVGTELFRVGMCDDFWVHRLMKVISDQPDFFMVVTDVRFPNEVEAIEAAGGIIIHLNRETGLTDDHPSETSLDSYTFPCEINNDGTKEELYKELENWIKELDI